MMIYTAHPCISFELGCLEGRCVLHVLNLMREISGGNQLGIRKLDRPKSGQNRGHVTSHDGGNDRWRIKLESLEIEVETALDHPKGRSAHGSPSWSAKSRKNLANPNKRTISG